jgi:hypothetical protein
MRHVSLKHLENQEEQRKETDAISIRRTPLQYLHMSIGHPDAR